ncbi:MAG: hypothetical protein RBT34_07280 [Anaerolineaceae bacterium]|jgi:hypothetical protein|nr:hypothetical protein [Anaerolineaceae bacterium]
MMDWSPDEDNVDNWHGIVNNCRLSILDAATMKEIQVVENDIDPMVQFSNQDVVNLSVRWTL